MKRINNWLSALLLVCLCLSLLLLVGCDVIPVDKLPSGFEDILGGKEDELPDVTHAHVSVSHEGLAPTCTEDGWLPYVTCATCDELNTYTHLDALGHDFSEEKLPSGDHHSRFCARCTATIDEEHTWSESDVLVAPTCEDGGSQSYLCTECGAMKIEDVQPLGHDFTDEYLPNGDCHSRFCTACSATVDLPHEWQAGDYVTAPTCECDGVQTYVCLGCSLTKDEGVGKLGHDFADNYLPNGDVHSRYCSRCDKTSDAPHEWQAGEYITAPNCEESGVLPYSCATCGAAKTEDVAALGHDFSAEYAPNGDVHSLYSSRCDTTLDGAHEWTLTAAVAPTCTGSGYESYSCAVCHAYDTRVIPATGEHVDGGWETVYMPTATVRGSERLRCAVCNNIIYERDIPCDADSMTVLYMTGEYQNATAAKNEVAMEFVLVSPDGTTYEGGATIKVQGATSVSYPKKNYTVKFYKDNTLAKKQKIDLGWGKESKYVIKANWVDAIQARNVVSCRLWGDIVASRNSSANQERLASLSTNGGAIDGFPIAVYMNGEFYGLYTLNVPKDEWLFGMDDSETEAILCADDWVNTDFSVLLTEFTENSAGDLVANNGGWELKYCGTDDTAWVTESFNNLIRFCQEKDGEEFKNGISQYLDVDAAIDYLIYLYAILMRDNTSKNMNWVTYDGVTWIPSVYDQDGTFGMVWDGKRYATSNSNLPSVKNGKVDVGFSQGNGYFILWDKMWNNFTEEILLRYKELRETVLSYDNMVAEFEAFRAEIPESIYAADIERWADDRAKWWNGDTYNGVENYYEKFDYEYIYTWLADRLSYYDNAMRNIYSKVYLPNTD